MYVKRRVVVVAERDYWNVVAARTEPHEGWDPSGPDPLRAHPKCGSRRTAIDPSLPHGRTRIFQRCVDRSSSRS
jgi:hypothetical protein